MIEMNKVEVVCPDIKIPKKFKGKNLNTDKVRYYLHTIRQQQYAKKHEDGGGRIYAKLMRDLLTAESEGQVRHFLIDNHITKTDGYFSQVDHTCKTYFITTPAKDRKFEIKNHLLKSKILLHRSKRTDKGTIEDKVIDDYLKSWLNKFDFDTEGAIKEVGENEKHLIPIVYMNTRNIKPDKYGRRHSPWTSLFTPLRKYTTYNNQPLINNDISNSQIVNFVKLYKETQYNKFIEESKNLNNLNNTNILDIISSQPHTPMVSTLFIRLTEEGKIYDYLLKQALKDKNTTDYLKEKLKKNKQKDIYKKMRFEYYFNSKKDWKTIVREFKKLVIKKNIEVEEQDLNRSSFKTIVFSDIFYGNCFVDTSFSRMFKRLFPEIAQFIYDYKKQYGFKELSHEMQRQESHLMINCVVGRLMTYHPEVPIITIHDSIMTTAEYCPLVQRIIKEEYKRAGLSPTIKQEK